MRNLLFVTFLFMISQSWAQNKAKIEKLLEFVKVKGGTFTMGSESLEVATPHKVKVSTFYMQKTEVTQELWEAVMGSNPSSDQTSKDNPVTYVSWDDCQEFIKKLNSLTGKKYSLPTEAEWEYAARGGKLSKGYKYAGSDEIDEVVWYSENCNTKVHPVAKKKPNELCLYDMSGNVEEWCADWYEDYNLKAQKDPKGPATGDTKVVRGGSWDVVAEGCLVACRIIRYPFVRYDDGGFRLLSPVK